MKSVVPLVVRGVSHQRNIVTERYAATRETSSAVAGVDRPCLVAGTRAPQRPTCRARSAPVYVVDGRSHAAFTCREAAVSLDAAVLGNSERRRCWRTTEVHEAHELIVGRFRTRADAERAVARITAETSANARLVHVLGRPGWIPRLVPGTRGSPCFLVTRRSADPATRWRALTLLRVEGARS